MPCWDGLYLIYTFKGDLDGIIEKQSEASESTAKSEAIKIEHLKIQQQPVIQWQEGNHEKRFNITDSVEVMGKQNGFCCSWMKKRQMTITTDTVNGIYRIKNLSKKMPLYYKEGEDYREVKEELTLRNGQQYQFMIKTMEFYIKIPEINEKR